MMKRLTLFCAATLLLPSNVARAIDFESMFSSGISAQQLAELIVEEGSYVSVVTGSAHVTINSVTSPMTLPKQIGTYDHAVFLDVM